VLRARAKERGLALSEVIRGVLSEALETPTQPPAVQPGFKAGSDKSVKLTIRLGPDAASRLHEAARACGVSHGAYLAGLINAAPPAPLAVANGLAASTDQLAAVSADLNQLIRSLDRSGPTSPALVNDWLQPLLSDVWQHVVLASRLVAELRPGRTPLKARNPAERATVEEAHS
jgi:hypothetical protein